MIKYLLILLCANLSSQSVGAEFLLLSPSATNRALGGSNASSNTYDLYTSFSNPAHSIIYEGLSAQSSNMFIKLYPNLANDIFIKTDIKRMSYSGDAIFQSDSYDFQISFTQSDTYLNIGYTDILNSIGEITGNALTYSKSKANTISLGFRSNSKPIYFSVGITKKDVLQNIIEIVPGVASPSNNYPMQSNNKMYDWGYRMVIDNYSFTNINFLDISSSIGYSKNNITDKFINIGASQDLAPRTARLGLSFGSRIRPFKDLKKFSISVNFNREAESLLIKELTFATSVYDDSMLGSIKIGDNLFKGISTSNVKIRKGREINIFDIYFIRNGKYIDDNGYSRNTKGYGIRYSRSALLFLSFFKLENKSTFYNSLLNNLNAFLNLIDVDYNYFEWHTTAIHYLHTNNNFEETTFTLKYEF